MKLKYRSKQYSYHPHVNIAEKVNAFFKLVRIEHAIMYAVAVVIGAVIIGGINAISSLVLIGALVSVLIEFGAFALNDFIDIKADRINMRIDRPLVTGEISSRFAFIFGIFSFIIANLISLVFLPSQAFLLILLFSILSLAYDFFLKNLPLLGNIVIALTMAVPFFFGAFIYSLENNFISTNAAAFQPALCLSAIAFFVGLGREIIKDIEDMKGDEASGGKTFPILFGKVNAARVAVLFFFVSIVLSIVPFFTFFANKPIYFMILVTDFMLFDTSLHVLKDQSLAMLKKVRKLTLVAIGLGLISFLLASF